MRIFDVANFPNPLRVRIALAEKGMGRLVQFVPVDLPNAEHKQPPFLAMNPEGTVPVLELDDGTFISECTAIIEYFDHLDGNTVLTGKSPHERAVISMMNKRAERELVYASGNYFHYGTPGGGSALEKYKRPEWKDRSIWAGFERERVLAGMRYFNAVLSRQTYAAGESFTMADISLWAGLYFASLGQISIPDQLIMLQAWHQRVNQRAAVQTPA